VVIRLLHLLLHVIQMENHLLGLLILMNHLDHALYLLVTSTHQHDIRKAFIQKSQNKVSNLVQQLTGWLLRHHFLLHHRHHHNLPLDQRRQLTNCLDDLAIRNPSIKQRSNTTDILITRKRACTLLVVLVNCV
jgi:hypothetical protein